MKNILKYSVIITKKIIEKKYVLYILLCKLCSHYSWYKYIFYLYIVFNFYKLYNKIQYFIHNETILYINN